MVNQEKFLQKELANSLTKKSYPHGKKKIQYILLVYQLYNLVGHRFYLLYKLYKLVMVTSRTHPIAKDTYLGPRPVRFDKTKSLRYAIPRSFGQVLGKLLWNFLQPNCHQTLRQKLRTRQQLEPPPEVLATHSGVPQHHLQQQQKGISTCTVKKESIRTQDKRSPRFF